MKTLDEYLNQPGFYLFGEDTLFAINDEGTATFIYGKNTFCRVRVPQNWEVIPIRLKRFYVVKKPEPIKIKRKIFKINPLVFLYSFVGTCLRVLDEQIRFLL